MMELWAGSVNGTVLAASPDAEDYRPGDVVTWEPVTRTAWTGNLVVGEGTDGAGRIWVGHDDGERRVLRQVEELVDDRRDRDPERLRQDHEPVALEPGERQRVGGLALALVHGQDRATDDLRDEGSGEEREAHGHGQELRREAQATAHVEATQLRVLEDERSARDEEPDERRQAEQDERRQ